MAKTSQYKLDWAEFERKRAAWTFTAAQYLSIPSPFQHYGSSEYVNPGNAATDFLDSLKHRLQSKSTLHTPNRDYEATTPPADRLSRYMQRFKTSENLMPYADRSGVHEMPDTQKIKAELYGDSPDGSTVTYRRDGEGALNDVGTFSDAQPTFPEPPMYGDPTNSQSSLLKIGTTGRPIFELDSDSHVGRSSIEAGQDSHRRAIFSCSAVQDLPQDPSSYGGLKSKEPNEIDGCLAAPFDFNFVKQHL